jgi:hypothetical protein
MHVFSRKRASSLSWWPLLPRNVKEEKSTQSPMKTGHPAMTRREEISESITKPGPSHRPNKRELTRSDKRGDTIVKSRYGLAIFWPISSRWIICRVSNSDDRESGRLCPQPPICGFLCHPLLTTARNLSKPSIWYALQSILACTVRNSAEFNRLQLSEFFPLDLHDVIHSAIQSFLYVTPANFILGKSVQQTWVKLLERKKY